MDDEFLASSAAHDGNDLSGVVAHGERWCVCAWAWASAVERDPERTEGLRLEGNAPHAWRGHGISGYLQITRASTQQHNTE